MVDTEQRFKNWSRVILLIAVAATCVFFVIFAIHGVVINQDKTCGNERNGPRSSAVTDNTSYVLDNSTDYLLQEFFLNTTNYIRYMFCYDVHVNGTTGEEIEVIDEAQTVLSRNYATLGLNEYCSVINITKDTNYLGIRCSSCSSTRNVIIQEVVAGDDKTIVLYDNGAINVSSVTQPSYTLNQFRDCRGQLRFFMWLYVWVLVGLFFVILILIGFRRFEKFIFEEIDMTKGN